MIKDKSASSKIKYGIDAPMVPIMYLLGGIAVLIYWYFNHSYLFSWIIFIYGLSLVLGGLVFLHTSLRGKFLIWDKIINELKIPNNSHILDLGCGHGAVLIQLAQKIDDSGRATGIDLWRNVDQSNNNLDAAINNLKLAQVDQKVDLITANMIQLPLKDNQFDFVVSSLAFHNIKPNKQRKEALLEACRVLKNNGQLIIVDTGNHSKSYKKILEDNNFVDITITSAGFIGWWTGPWMGTYIIKAKK